MRPRVTLGTNISFIGPEIIPIDLVIEVLYDPTSLGGGVDFLAAQMLAILQQYIDPSSIALGAPLEYEEILRLVYDFDFVKSVNNLTVRSMLKDSSSIEGLCAGFAGDEDEEAGVCDYDYIGVVDVDNQVQDSFSPIASYKLYRVEIGFTSINDFSPLTFYYDNLYTT
jgi:hypothetical protein